MKMLIDIPDNDEEILSRLISASAKNIVALQQNARDAQVAASGLTGDDRKAIIAEAHKNGADAANKLAAQLRTERRRSAVKAFPIPRKASKNSLVMDALHAGLLQLQTSLAAE